jgi:hypothetical protein
LRQIGEEEHERSDADTEGQRRRESFRERLP